MTAPDRLPARPLPGAPRGGSDPRSITECLDRLDALLAASPPFFRPGRRAVRDAEARRLLRTLREALSREIQQAEGVQAEAEAVLRRAQDEARRIVVEAEEHARRALEDGTLVRAAELAGRQLREDAAREAAETRKEADAYALEVLGRLEREVAHVLATVQRGKTILAGGTPGREQADGSGGADEARAAPPDGTAAGVDNGKMASV